MQTIYQNKSRIEDFWETYWDNLPRDPDHISDKSIYPLFPVDEFVKRDMDILEAGCGMGRVFKHYFYEQYNIVGLDYIHNCLAKLHQENPNFNLLRSDAKALPFGPGHFDLVMAFGLISSIQDPPESILQEMNRILKPEGLICASVAADTFLRRLQNIIGWCSHTLAKFRGKPSNRFFFARAYRPAEWEAILTQAGFTPVRTEPTHSRVLLWEYLPFLRASDQTFSLTEARDGDTGYRLTRLGESIFQWLRRWLPWSIAVGVVCVAKRTQEDASKTSS